LAEQAGLAQNWPWGSTGCLLRVAMAVAFPSGSSLDPRLATRLHFHGSPGCYRHRRAAEKNHPGVQGKAVSGPAEGVPLAGVGIPPGPEGTVSGGQGEAGGVVPQAPPAAAAVRDPGAF